MQTVLITGCSTGFGRETALEFLDKGWNVVATMRDPSASTLPAAGRLRVLPLDVTDPDSIAAAVAAAGPVDVLVNNAGIGWLNAIEGTPMETARRIFDANLFGAVAMMQAVLPDMRERRTGAIVNVGSSSTYKPLPLLSVYRASKAALNALTESADLELARFGIRARVVLPGRAPSTAFGDSARSQVMGSGGFPEPYADFAHEVMTTMMAADDEPLTTARDVAEAIYRAATDPDCPMMLPAGPDAIAWATEK
ncbi:MAG: SDR family oxidoreductase [Phenylobacterium sp.]|uniref:SDR family oxidoreductase n=1 Tax=Phenylobacterium sp. TaxID=1871053 RepID=UPI00271B8E35|nr:SDR family oxidoreductase [Phenylobacterium sp.]MDO8408933.1 SDR family oxidoreductase [Phenylobacterium sp.]